MNQRIAVPLATLVTAATTFAYGALPTATTEATVSQDLKTTIILQGKTCDEVIDVKRNADSNYVAACKDGNRYHIFVDTQGRVVVQKQ